MLTSKSIVVILSLLAVPGFVIAGSLVPGAASSDDTQRTEKQTLSMGNVENIRVKVPFGNVTVRTGRGDKVQLTVSRSVHDHDSADGRRWVRESKLNTSTRNGELLIEEVAFGVRPPQDVHGPEDPRYNLTIEAPANTRMTVNVGAGEIRGEGGYRNLSGRVGAGSIILGMITVQDRLHLDVGAGDIRATLRNTPSQTAVLGAGTGKIDLRLNAGTHADVSAVVGVGSIAGIPGKQRKDNSFELGDRRAAKIGGGGTSMELNVGVGSISIGTTDRVVASANVDPAAEENAVKVEDEQAEAAAEVVEAQAEQAMGLAEQQADQKEIDSEIQNAMRDAQREMDQAMREVSKALSDEKLQRKIHAEVAQAMKESTGKRDAAFRQAERELDRAMHQLNGEMSVHGVGRNAHGNEQLERDIKALVESALRMARDAMRQSRQELQRGR